MRVIVLARSEGEARTHLTWAGIASKDSTIVKSPRTLLGLQLHDEDLIVELPRFRDRPDADSVIGVLQRLMKGSGAVPRWEKITG